LDNKSKCSYCWDLGCFKLDVYKDPDARYGYRERAVPGICPKCGITQEEVLRRLNADLFPVVDEHPPTG
jgi:hypothetical protein